MVCMKWLFDRSHSYSIGEVLNFLPLKDKVDQGLILNITGGFRCWNKLRSNFTQPFTTIHMICDLNKGVGNPEPRSNYSGKTLTLVLHKEFVKKIRVFCNISCAEGLVMNSELKN